MMCCCHTGPCVYCSQHGRGSRTQDFALPTEIRDALEDACLFGCLKGEFERAFPQLTEHHLGVDSDFSYVALRELLLKLVKDLDA